ncbi:MAG: hypothetical protein CFH21_00263 [Alphaproteobacteria bacterium MarineAlpha5_Bin11]|nr:hypothetical protein [Pelagibacteraceae bacterium]PPR44611.1 MAG: hypothetical protein CFH21_00263 [Alphaproteobacteria bacterium MarineAlpha5_Bin11]|tara:strand:+ start:75 stop:638 length:564 start_codon:yes stop_codon:yes gene_type:complete
MIIVTSLKDHLSVCESVNPSHLISVIDPGFEPSTPNSTIKHLKLGFDDIIAVSKNNIIHRQNEKLSHQIPPNDNHINNIVDFVSTWDQSQPIVIHCWCGVSRSMATATFILCLLNPNNVENNIKYLRSIAPHANPNKLMISMFEKHLGIVGEIKIAFEKYPHTKTYDCETTFAPVSIFNIKELREYK